MAANSRIQELCERIPAIICELEPTGKTRYVNGAVTGILGYDPRDLCGANWWDVFYPGDARADAEDLLQRLQEGDVVDYKTQTVAKDGSVRVLSWHSANQFDASGTLVSILGFAVDRTEQSKTDADRANIEKQLYFSGRMESLGRLAGGMAHDFNNLLAVIISYAELVASELEPDDPLAEDLEEIRLAGRRAADLTEQLLLFSRREVVRPELMDLNRMIDGLHKLLKRAIGENIKLVTNLDPDLAPVRADPGKIELMLVNLTVHARDAMKKGGELRLETSNANIDEAFARKHIGLSPGRYARLVVHDSGPGLTDAEAQHVFEPFFDRRQKGPHVDLGLATVYGIVRQAAGTIWVESSQRAGTSFHILLPKARQVLPRKAISSGTHSTVGGGETILVVEDESALRSLMTRVLRKHGYHVLVAQNGEEALVAAHDHNGRIDLLLTDVIMPGISGKQLADMLTAGGPETQVMYISGYTDDTMADHGVVDENVVLLKKPFTVKQLLRSVQEAIGDPEER